MKATKKTEDCLSNAKIGVRRTYTYPPELLKSIEDEADKRLRENSSHIGKIQQGSVCRNIVCIAIKRALPEISKMSKQEFEQHAKQLSECGVTHAKLSR